MTRPKLIAGALAGLLLAWLIAPQLFSEFRSVRKKVVRDAIEATGNQLRVPLPAEVALETLKSPFAAISRIKNTGTQPLHVRVAVDAEELCVADIPAGRSQRIDCAVRGAWSGREDHVVLFSADGSFTVEYFELATHYGSLTIGPRNVIVVAKGFSGFERSSLWHVLAILALVTLSVWSVRERSLPTFVSAIHLTATVAAGCVVAAVVVSRFVSPYALVISDTFLEKILLFTALPRLLSEARALIRRYPRGWLVARMIGVGLIVGSVFWSFVSHRIVDQHAGNASGQLLISHRFFDKSPMAGNKDLEQTLLFTASNGYDGQFFYYMTFDPFLVTFRDQPSRYGEYIDFPPYRYGRIGFSLLTRLFAAGDPVRYPVTMVTLLVVALGLCATLLAAIAHRHGFSLWWGFLILFIPGFWQCAEGTLPEPLAAAFFLAAYWCLLHRRWWVCGALLGVCMLMRETSGGLVLAAAAGLLLTGKRREGAIVTLMAFGPIVLWKGFVGTVFWPEYGMAGVMPHPNDAGLPFGGVVKLWTTIARGEYFDGWPGMNRAGLILPWLTTAGAALALIATVKRANWVTAAALFYGALTILFNYESVWLDIGNAERLSIDLFVALAVVFLQLPPNQRALKAAFVVFWSATAWYVLYGTYNAVYHQDAVFGLIF